MSVEEPGHDGERGALVPLGAALYWLQQWPLIGLAAPGSFFWFLSLTEPLLVFGIPNCILTETCNNGNPAIFQTGHFGQVKTMTERNILLLVYYVQASLQTSLQHIAFSFSDHTPPICSSKFTN